MSEEHSLDWATDLKAPTLFAAVKALQAEQATVMRELDQLIRNLESNTSPSASAAAVIGACARASFEHATRLTSLLFDDLPVICAGLAEGYWQLLQQDLPDLAQAATSQDLGEWIVDGAGKTIAALKAAALVFSGVEPGAWPPAFHRTTVHLTAQAAVVGPMTSDTNALLGD